MQYHGVSLEWLSNQRLLRETESRLITRKIRQLQLRLYEHMASYPEADVASRIIFERDTPVWRGSSWRPQSSGQVDASYWKLIAMWRDLQWGRALGDRQSCHRRVGRATHLLAYALNDWLISDLSPSNSRNSNKTPEIVVQWISFPHS